MYPSCFAPLQIVWEDIRRQTMARLGSAAELKEALNCLSLEDAWGNRADVDKMFLDGFTSLKHITTVQPDLLQRYGVPAAQTGTLQQLAKEAVAEGKILYVSSPCILKQLSVCLLCVAH